MATSSSSSATLPALLAAQSALIARAAEAVPQSFKNCTYSLGHLRQKVFVCLTCTPEGEEGKGICGACSVACHGDHKQEELFDKREFRCDCPTESLKEPCTLNEGGKKIANETNHYGDNFKGLFCHCKTRYEGELEREPMLQCLACEDWFHESCLNLRERAPLRERTAPTPPPELDPLAPTAVLNNPHSAHAARQVDDDAVSIASSASLPPPLIPERAYESFVCGPCVRKSAALRHIAGTPGAMMVAQSKDGSSLEVLGRTEDEYDTDADVSVCDTDTNGPMSSPSKRFFSPPPAEPTTNSSSAPGSKRSSSLTRSSPAKKSKTCTFAETNYRAQEILSSPSSDSIRGDLFLKRGFRDRWCSCGTCPRPDPLREAYLLSEEDTFELPEDPDANVPLEELGMRALQGLPREAALETIRAYISFRDDLMEYLRPIAAQGRAVNNEDIKRFFDERTERDRELAKAALTG